MIAIDVGNTKTQIGFFRDGNLKAQWRMGTDLRMDANDFQSILEEYLSSIGQTLRSDSDFVVASVVPSVSDELRKLDCQSRFLFVDNESPLSFEISIPVPQSLGADRIADLEGAVRKYGAPVIVVDAGTATTVNVVNERRQFIGGAIAPGMGISLDALFGATAKLIPGSLPAVDSAIGQTTEEAIAVGVLLGHAAMIEGLVKRTLKEMGDPKIPVIAKGGSIETLVGFIETPLIVDQNLLLDGLHCIYENQRGRRPAHAS